MNRIIYLYYDMTNYMTETLLRDPITRINERTSEYK